MPSRNPLPHKMAFKIIFWSCLLAVLAYLTYQELTVVTDSYSMQIEIPAKRSDVFRVLADPELFPLKIHPLCVGVSNITRSPEQEGSKALQFINHDRIPLLPLLNISLKITFQVNLTVIEENAIIQNKANLIGGILQLKQHWYVADSKNGSGDETLLKHHFEFTTARILSRFMKRMSLVGHNNMLKSIRQYFVETSQGPNDNIST